MILLQVVATKAQEKCNSAVDMWSEKHVTLIFLILVKFVKQTIIMQHLMEVEEGLLFWLLSFFCILVICIY